MSRLSLQERKIWGPVCKRPLQNNGGIMYNPGVEVSKHCEDLLQVRHALGHFFNEIKRYCNREDRTYA